MSEGLLIAVAVVVTIFNIAGAAFGAAGKLAVFSALGVVGLVATVTQERRRAGFRDALASMPPGMRNQVLVALENDALRAEAVHDLGIAAPPVPLRRPEERFPYRPSHAHTVRWTLHLWFLLGGVLSLGLVADRWLGQERFSGAWLSSWEIAGVVLIWIVGTSLTWWLRHESKGVVLVNEGGIALHRPGRAARRIAWSEIVGMRFGGLSHRFRITSASERIGVGATIQEYGRLLNLVHSRLPAGARVQAR